MTKADLIAAVAEQTGIEKAHVSETVEAFFTVVKDSLAKGENIYVRGFGSFVNKKRAKKITRNISGRTAVVIDEHYVPSFKPSKVFIEQKVNSNVSRNIEVMERYPHPAAISRNVHVAENDRYSISSEIDFIYTTQAYRIFENKKDFEKWLHFPSDLLSKQKPIDVFLQKNGEQKIKDALYRIEHGVLA